MEEVRSVVALVSQINSGWPVQDWRIKVRRYAGEEHSWGLSPNNTAPQRIAAEFCISALRSQTLSSRACGMARSARPGWGLAGQLKKTCSQATEGLITDPDWGHQWKLTEDTHGGSEVSMVWSYFPDDYFHYVSVSFISGCNLKAPIIKFL